MVDFNVASTHKRTQTNRDFISCYVSQIKILISLTTNKHYYWLVRAL